MTDKKAQQNEEAQGKESPEKGGEGNCREREGGSREEDHPA